MTKPYSGSSGRSSVPIQTCGSDGGGAREVKAVEIAARVVEALRATGNYQARYDSDEERAVLQQAARIARATVRPRRITARTTAGVFYAVWSEPTPLEDELRWHQMVDAVNAVQPKNWQQRLARRQAGRRQDGGQQDSPPQQ